MKPLILSLLLAASLSAKTVERSCPICGQCEPESVPLETLGINEYLPIWYCNSPSREVRYLFVLRCDSTIKGDCDATIKWVPKRVEVTDSTWRQTGRDGDVVIYADGKWWWQTPITDDAIQALPISPYAVTDTKKRKCVDEIKERNRCVNPGHEHLSDGTFLQGTLNTCFFDSDTTWCNCDGDSAYWRTVPQLLSDSCEAYGCAIFVRREDRWRKETKTVTTWIKRKKTVKEVWE